MMQKVVAIYGKSCSLKSDIAMEISRLTGYKVKNVGEALTTRAKVLGLNSGAEVEDAYHRIVNQETIDWVQSAPDPVIIIESTHLGFVIDQIDDIFRVEVSSDQKVRQARWDHRKEQGGGRTRQIGESLDQRDRDDEDLRQRLYAQGTIKNTPNLVLDSSDRNAEDCAREIWEAYEGKGSTVRDNDGKAGKPEMDKKLTKGIRPGPSSGTVIVYSVKRNPFGGYIADEKSQKGIFVHRSAVEEAGLDGLAKGQHMTFDIEEDGVGGFRAVKLKLSK